MVEVYTHLDSMNLAVPGGRAVQVGVGGFISGGLLGIFLTIQVMSDRLMIRGWSIILFGAQGLCL